MCSSHSLEHTSGATVQAAKCTVGFAAWQHLKQPLPHLQRPAQQLPSIHAHTALLTRATTVFLAVQPSATHDLGPQYRYSVGILRSMEKNPGDYPLPWCDRANHALARLALPHAQDKTMPSCKCDCAYATATGRGGPFCATQEAQEPIQTNNKFPNSTEPCRRRCSSSCRTLTRQGTRAAHKLGCWVTACSALKTCSFAAPLRCTSQSW